MNFVMFACLWFVLLCQNYAASAELLTQSKSSNPKENLPRQSPSCLPYGLVMCCQQAQAHFNSI